MATLCYPNVMGQNRIFSLLLLAVALSFCIFAVQSGDVFMYLALARDFIFSGEWSRRSDPYLYSLSNAELVWTHEYLSYVLFAAFHHALGIPGLIFLKICAWGAIFIITLAAGPREKNSSWLWIAMFLLAVLAGSFRFIERSSMFSDLFCVWLCTYLLSQERVDRKMVLTLTGAFWLWAQLHPGFALGLFMLGVWIAERIFLSRTVTLRQSAWLLLPVAALAVHPDGVHGLLYPFQFAFSEATVFKKFNFEWMPSYSRLFRFAPETLAFWLLALCSLVVLYRAKGWRSLRGIYTLAFIAIATQTVRFVPWVSFALLICLKPWAELKYVQPRRWQSAILGVFLALLATKNLVYGYTASSGERLPKWDLDPKFFPVRTEEFLREKRIQGQLYNTHDFGSYLVWKKQLPIFHHGFVTDMRFYEEDVIGVFKSQQRFLELASKYGWTMLLVEKHGAYKYFWQILSPLTQWKIVAEDESSYLIYLLPN